MSELGLNQNFSVFISHAGEDSQLVDSLVSILQWNNITPLVAENIPEPGTFLWKDKIKSLINQCNYFIVLYTYNAQNKAKVHQEIGSAGIKDKRIIVLLQDGLDRRNLEGYLEGLEIVENFNPFDPFGAFINITCILLNHRYGKQTSQMYGYNPTYGKILLKYDETAGSWITYRIDSHGGRWVRL
jgi:hypothetical protein